MASAWAREYSDERRAGPGPRRDAANPFHEVDPATGMAVSSVDHLPIASVNGRPIARGRVIGLLLRSHGPGALEQLVVHDEAVRLATQMGLSVSENDLEREHQLALRRLADPLASVTAGAIDNKEAQRLLELVLADRNISPEEYRLSLERNAYLRKIVQANRKISDEELEAEFQRSFGRRVQVRHIQLATPGQVARVQERLRAGERFEDLARMHSANQASASRGGLLEPFSEHDDRLPALFRREAFALRPGEVSESLRIGNWFHLLMLERHVEPVSGDWRTMREQLQRAILERESEPAMAELFDELYRDARIEIHDDVLREAVRNRR